MKKRKIAALLLGMACVCGVCAGGCGSQKEEPQEEPQAARAVTESPKSDFSNLNNFTADTLGKGTFTQENFADKDLTVINFWALFCGPCIAEMPDIAAFEKTLPDNVQLITVCLDGEEAPEEAKAILEEAGFEGETLLGGDGDYQKVFGEIQYTPTTVFVDADGNMTGNTLIGGQADLAQSYGDAINGALKSLGKEEIDFGNLS